MTRPGGILIAAAVSLLLAGCTAEPPQPKPDAPSLAKELVATPPRTPLPAQGFDPAVYGPRVELPGGLLLKQVGKVAELRTVDDQTWVSRLVVERIEVDPVCDQYTPAPKRGHRVLLTIAYETSPSYSAPGVVVQPPLYYAWSTVGKDGITEGSMNVDYGCHDTDALPSEFRPAAKYRGEVVLDTENPSGQVVYDMFAWDY